MRWGGFFDVPGLDAALESLNDRTLAPGFWDDPEGAQKVLQERAKLEDKIARFKKLAAEVKDLRELVDMADGDQSIVDEVATQIPVLSKRTRELELERMLSGNEDKTDAIITIHPGTGGNDAQEWAEMLLRMYLRWCEKKGFKTEMVDHQPGDEAGLKGASFEVHGAYAYGFLRAENGIHRLIRISPFSGKRETGFAAVFVVPDLEEDTGDVVIKPEDLEVDTYRAGGKGGQHVNKTESAIRITHVPTGIIVACQAERSQHKNRATAMKMLRGRIYEKNRLEREAAFRASYSSDKMEIGFGSQIRTYTMAPYRLVKDERTGFKSSNVDAVLDGDLDDFIEEYLLWAAGNRMPNRASVDAPAKEA